MSAKNKLWYRSKTLWAALLMAAVEIVRANGWCAIPPSVDMLLLSAIVYGRVTASGPISKRKPAAQADPVPFNKEEL